MIVPGAPVGTSALARMPAAENPVYLLTPRPSMPPGSWIAAGDKPGGGNIDFASLLFNKESKGLPRLRWPRHDSARDRGGDVKLFADRLFAMSPISEAAS